MAELETVTVVAYGKQRKESIIGAINTIDTDELRIQSGQLSTSLAGKLAGVVVMQRGWVPAPLLIRGVNTFGANNKPLILVDGIEREDGPRGRGRHRHLLDPEGRNGHGPLR